MQDQQPKISKFRPLRVLSCRKELSSRGSIIEKLHIEWIERTPEDREKMFTHEVNVSFVK